MGNGPNPRYRTEGRYHWFDGDGMLHGIHPLTAIEIMAGLGIDRLMVPAYPIARAEIDEGVRLIAEIIDTAASVDGD